jgi:hypothetical protein
MRSFETTRRHCRSYEGLVRWKIVKSKIVKPKIVKSKIVESKIVEWKIRPGYCGCGDELEG